MFFRRNLVVFGLLFTFLSVDTASADINLCLNLKNLKVAKSVLELNGCLELGDGKRPRRGNHNSNESGQQFPQYHDEIDSSEVCELNTTGGINEEFIFLRLNDVEINNPLVRLSNHAEIINLHKDKKDEWGHEHTKIRVLKNYYTEGQLPLAPNGITGWILTGVFKCY